jgi:hypothetical protein
LRDAIQSDNIFKKDSRKEYNFLYFLISSLLNSGKHYRTKTPQTILSVHGPFCSRVTVAIQSPATIGKYNLQNLVGWIYGSRAPVL